MADAELPDELAGHVESDACEQPRGARQLKILLVCPYYPPENAVASLRIAAFARHWASQGCEVHVICRAPLSTGMSPPPSRQVVVHRIADPLGRTSASIHAHMTALGARSRLQSAITKFKKLVVFPDSFVLWAFRSWLYTRRLDFAADVVVGSGGPLSALVLARRIALRLSVPLVVDFRDPISTAHDASPGLVRPRLLKSIEARVVQHSSLAVTVSKRLSDHLRSVHSKDFAVVYNGYEPELLRREVAPGKTAELTLVITGTVYPAHSDMRPLFRAIALLRDRLPAARFRVEHYGPDQSFEALASWASECGVRDLLTGHGRVAHSTSISAQLRSDAVVLAAWFDDVDPGNLPGKLFEYLGSGRPIIQVGGMESEAAELIRMQPNSLASSDVHAILDHLEKLWTSRGPIEARSEVEARFSQLTRETQSLVFLSLIERRVGLAAS